MNGETKKLPRRTLTWNDVKDGAGAVFNVWFLGSELQWAERAWGSLEKAGLTTYAGAVGETRVWVRLLALASIYWDFSHHGADEEVGWDDLYSHATEGLSIEPLRLGQLVGADFEAEISAATKWNG